MNVKILSRCTNNRFDANDGRKSKSSLTFSKPRTPNLGPAIVAVRRNKRKTALAQSLSQNGNQIRHPSGDDAALDEAAAAHCRPLGII
jgi:hypothetical protein